MNIIGISAFYHDSGAVLIQNGRLTAAAQQERFTRKKHDPGFPDKAIGYCLTYAGLTLDKVDRIVFYDKPMLKFERLLETYYTFAPTGLKSFLTAMPVWIKEKLFLKSLIRRQLKEAFPDILKLPEIAFSNHHLSHSASAFFPSPFEESAILTIDGVGEWATTTISHGKGNSIKLLKELRFPHSWGLLYSAFTYYTGFRVNSGEYKLMGLAPYGNPDSDETKRYEKIIRDELISLKEDGSLWINMDYFEYPVGLKMTKNKKWENLFSLPVRQPETELAQSHMNLAYAIQKVTEEGILRLAKEAKRLTQSKNLAMAGGVALNCVANGALIKSKVFENLWIQPAAGDAGGALGAALASWHIQEGKKRVSIESKGKGIDVAIDEMSGSYLGPEFSSLDIECVARKYQSPFKKIDDFDTLAQRIAEEIDKGNVIGWFQGRMEWGPRALGNRSIIGDARNKEMQKKLNLKIKYRESFRPFAPSVLAESNDDFFDIGVTSPYMLLVGNVNESRCEKLPDDFQIMSLKEKLYCHRSDVPAITHLNFSARVQTVHKETNPRYWKLIQAFKNLTGYGVIVNTSFNVRGEPIVCTPEDAYRCFMRTEMDYLVLGDYIFDKKEQPHFDDKQRWQEQYPLD